MIPQLPLLFFTCTVGAEAALKKELTQRRPSWRMAFSRPGFLSYKLPHKLPCDYRFDTVFGHSYGFALGKSAYADAAQNILEALHIHGLDQQKVRLHCRERAVHEIRESLNPMEPLAVSLESQLRAEDRGSLFYANAEAKIGEVVVDVLVIDKDMVVYGLHYHHAGHSPYAGGKPPIVLPAEAPSRAWLKFEEAILWHPQREHLDMVGRTVIEIGSAPGGTAYALQQRGAHVISIDPAGMDARVSVQHIRKSASAVQREELPKSFDWLLIDINDNPGATLRLAAKFVGFSAKRPHLIVTLKTSDWALADNLPDYVKKLVRLGYPEVRARQLYHGRREIVLLA